MFYVVVREGKRISREKAGKNRREAERQLRAIGVKEDNGTYAAPKRITVGDWASQWCAALQVKTSTKHSYGGSVRILTRAIGHKQVRDVRPDDVRAILAGMDKLAGATKARHCRAWHLLFESARESGYTGSNPVRGLTRSERPRPHRREAAFFEPDELARLFSVIVGDDGLLRLCRIAYATGCRLGELSAVTWADVDLTGNVLHVRRTWTDGRLGTPKSGQRREVDLTSDAVQLLADQWADTGRPDDHCLVFPGPTATGYLSQRAVATALYAAMDRAGIQRKGANREERSFHSFRHSHAAACLASGMSLYVVSRRLGHSAIQTTTSLYGHLAVDERKRQARLLEGAFAV